MSFRTVDSELVADTRCMIGEGPVWDSRRQRMVWVDIPAGQVHAFDPHDRSVTTRQVGQPVGSVGLCRDGGFIAALRDGVGVFAASGDAMSGFVAVEQDVAANRMNDGKCDCRGRFWAGSMASDHTRGAGTLYRIEAAHGELTASAQLPGLTIANGLDWSLDNKRMYYVDSATQRIDVFDFDADAGQIGNRRAFVAIAPAEGLPDGMMVDGEDHVWVALFGAGRVRRYSPRGEIDLEVRVPVTLVTSCAFGGPDMRDLYITTARHRLTAAEAETQTTAGGLFVSRPGPVGRLPNLFAG